VSAFRSSPSRLSWPCWTCSSTDSSVTGAGAAQARDLADFLALTRFLALRTFADSPDRLALRSFFLALLRSLRACWHSDVDARSAEAPAAWALPPVMATPPRARARVTAPVTTRCRSMRECMVKRPPM
jgi:hypothetical protein